MNSKINFETALSTVISLPLVRIDRSEFLESELKKYCEKDQIETAITHNPAYAGINHLIIEKLASACINYETNKVSVISFAAGIPGGPAMIGTIPADITQYLAHILRILQKLIYLYGWNEILEKDGKLDDETTNLITLFIGVMFGVNSATSTITRLSTLAAAKAGKSLTGKALTKGVIYPIVKKIAQKLGVEMTKDIFAKGVAKIIPVIGGLASGGLTYVTFKPMSIKFRKYLATLKWCDVEYYKTLRKEGESTTDDEGNDIIIDVE